MLFLYRPRQTWMPFRRPLSPTQQAAYNRHLQDQFAATRRLPAPVASAELPPPNPPRDVLGQLQALADLHASGALSDDELATAKARVLAEPAAT